MNYVPVFIISKGVSSEAVVQRCYVEKVPLKTFQNSQENTYAKVSF